MKNYYQSYANNLFCKYFPNMIRSHMKDYELYFVTFTFENQFQELFTDIYKNYFKALYQNINQFTINNPSYNSHLKAKMVLIPEKSNDTKAQTLVRGCHYHGILMINKEVNHNFEDKCMIQLRDEYQYNQETFDLKTIKKFLPHPDIVYQSKERMPIKHYSFDWQVIGGNESTVFDICSYMTKNLGSRYDKKCNLSLSNIREYGQKRVEEVTKQHKGDGFTYEDVLFFGDISKTDTAKYKPLHIRKARKYPKIIDKSLPQTPFRKMLLKKQAAWLKRFYRGFT